LHQNIQPDECNPLAELAELIARVPNGVNRSLPTRLPVAGHVSRYGRRIEILRIACLLWHTSAVQYPVVFIGRMRASVIGEWKK
jgi:hypothetical protein